MQINAQQVPIYLLMLVKVDIYMGLTSLQIFTVGDSRTLCNGSAREYHNCKFSIITQYMSAGYVDKVWPRSQTLLKHRAPIVYFSSVPRTKGGVHRTLKYPYTIKQRVE